jgi:hypothetical protein
VGTRRPVTTLGGVSPWVWFVIGGVSAAVGVVLLAVDRSRRTAWERERREWAELRGWRFVVDSPGLANRWQYGALARSGAGIARNLVEGTLFTSLGRRQVQVFDHEQRGRLPSVVVAVQRRCSTDLVVELWLPEHPHPAAPGLEPLGTVGERCAFGNDPERIHPLITSELLVTCNAVGADIPVVWLEQDWVLAAAPATVPPPRLELLLRALDELADQLDGAASSPGRGADEC